MRTSSRLVLATLTAAVVLGAAVGTAGARRFELSAQAIRAVWTGFELGDGFRLSRCQVTLEGSFHSRTISKVSGQLVGYITEARTTKSTCVEETRSLWMDEGINVTLPWHIRYNSFSGTLPSITAITFQLVGLGVKYNGTPCEYKSNATRPVYLIAALTGGTMTSLRFDESGSIPRINGLECLENGTLRGISGAVTVQGSTTTRITVRLIQ